MDKTQRAALLRERLRAVRGYDLAPVKPKGPARVWTERAGKSNFNPLGAPTGSREFQAKWCAQPDAKPLKLTPEIKRSRGESPLTALARKWRR